MSGGSCVPRCSDFRTAPPSCVPCFPGPSPQRAAVQGLDFRAYLLSSPLRPGIAASRGPASGVVSHGRAARPAVLLPVPLRHVCLRSAGLKPFALGWCPSGHSHLLSRRILSRGVRPFPVHRCPAGSSRLVSGRPLSIDLRSVISTCCRPVPLGCFPPRCTAEQLRYIPSRQGEHTVMLVLAYDRRIETPVHAIAALAGRPHVRHCSGRHSMMSPWGLTS